MAATSLDPEPFITQPLLANLYDQRDLLDLSGPESPPQVTQTQATTTSFFGAIAAGVGHLTHPTGSTTPPPAGSPSAGHGPGSTSPEPQKQSTAAPPISTSPAASKTEVRCVEGFANNLYVGGSDGVIEWWVFDGSAGTSENRGWKLRHKHKVFPCRPISQIVLLPKVSRALVLSEGTLHPLSLPSLEPVASSLIQPLRGVISVVLNDDELDLGVDGEGSTDMTVVIVRRKGLGIYRVGNRMTAVKEIPLPAPPRSHALFGTYLCASVPSETGLVYCIIDLSDASLTEVLPVSQIDPVGGDWMPNPNVAVIPGANQFLVTSYTGSNTMGVFLNGQGDPERGTMEWEHHPVSIAVESGFIVALLANNTVVIHSLVDLEQPVQTIKLDPELSTFTLSYSPYGVSIRDLLRDERMALTRFTLLSGRLAPAQPSPSVSLQPVPNPDELTASRSHSASPGSRSSGQATPDEPPSGSGLTPPSSPRFQKQPIRPPTSTSLLSSSGVSTQGRLAPFSTAIAETLLVSRHSVQGLTPLPVILRLEQLCVEHRIDEAIALVDEERRKGRRGEIEVDKATHSATMRLLHSYLGCSLLLETVFERAGDYFMRSKIDPRLLVRLYPEFRGQLIGTAEDVEVLDGLTPMLEKMGTVDDIISDSIGRTKAEDDLHPPTHEDLRIALYDSAKSMLTQFLRKTRTSRRKNGGNRGMDSRKLDMVIDTTFAKLLAEEGTTNELLSLLASPNDVVLEELEPFLEQRKYLHCTVLRVQGRMDRVLEILKQLAEDPTPDPLCPDPVGELVQQLEAVDDMGQIRQYSLWLAKAHPDKALSLLIAKGKQMNFNDAQLVEDLLSVDRETGYKYLEHVVVAKQSTDRDLHEQLLGHLLDQAAEFVQDYGIKYHIEELDAEFRLQPEPKPYAKVFADLAPPTPFKTLRLKLIIFLQFSQFFSLDSAAERLEKLKEFILERAIVFGRLRRDREALQLLAQDLQDSVSAQAYCAQGGEVVPPKVARKIARRMPELAGWPALGDHGGRRRGTIDVSPEVQHRLVTELLGTYMRDAETSAAGGGSRSSIARASELLSAQGVHLDSLEVLNMAPDDWPLDAITTFYKRSFRRELYEQRTWQILKSISAGENLQTSEKYLEAMSKVKPVVNMAGGQAGGDEDVDEKLDEDEQLSEKLAEKLTLGAMDGGEAHAADDTDTAAAKEMNGRIDAGGRALV